MHDRDRNGRIRNGVIGDGASKGDEGCVRVPSTVISLSAVGSFRLSVSEIIIALLLSPAAASVSHSAAALFTPRNNNFTFCTARTALPTFLNLVIEGVCGWVGGWVGD